jgi:Rps23 Pro-64 3,4-dihydroxylase Tpa1-like proline 4-hydroxylase
MRLYRRVNILLYLNEKWDVDAWKGGLELWKSDLSSLGKIISPIFNRMVIFVTNSESKHGHPRPLNCPENVFRKSLALYYYSSNIDPGEEILLKTTEFSFVA